MMDVPLEDFQALSIERSIQSSKSAEELERLTVDERLSPIERAVYLLSSGQEVQRTSVITTLPELLEDNKNDCMRRIVPKIREVLHVAQTEMQLAACGAFLQILQKDLIALDNYAETFLPSILTSLDNRDPDIAGAWLDTLLDVIDLLPKEIIKKDVLSVAISKGQLSQSVQSRLACCRILGKIATKFEHFVIKKDILPIVQSLCQDVDYEVRGCMCRQLDAVARGLGLEQTKCAILPELVELTNDEESYVRLTGLETVVNILSLLDDETRVNTIIALVCKFCTQALTNKDSTLSTVSKLFGKLAHGLSGNLNDEQRRWFIDYYKKLCRLGDSEAKKNKEAEATSPKTLQPPPLGLFFGFDTAEEEEEDDAVECRKNAGFNFPAMVLFIGPQKFKSELLPVMNLLTEDSNPRVRKTIAHSLHEVCNLIGSNAHLVLPDLIKLLQDDSIEVLSGIIGHLPETLQLLANSCRSNEKHQNSFLNTIPAILLCETVISASNNWRLQETFISQLICLPDCFPSNDIYSKFIPLLFRKLQTARAHPVRRAACRSLMILMRQNRRLEQRQDMCFRITEDLCHGHSYFQRVLFLEICNLVLELYSRAFFKENFFEALLDLTLDPVPNVRLRLCPFFPRLKAIIRLPAERSLLQQLETSVRRLLGSERDRDVRAALEKAVMELDRVQVLMESKRGCIDEDEADLRKEEEERKLIELEEKEKKEEEMKSAKGERKGKDGTKKGDSKIPGPSKGRSKIPGASQMSKDKNGGSRADHALASSNTTSSSSLSGKGERGSVHKQGSRAKLTKDGRLSPPGASTNVRRGSASSQSSASSASTVSSSGSSIKNRRSSIGTLHASLHPEGRKSSGPRRISLDSVPAGKEASSSRRK